MTNDSGKAKTHSEVVILAEAVNAPTQQDVYSGGLAAAAIDTTLDGRTVRWTSSPARVMVELTRGVKTVLIHSAGEHFSELFRAIDQYHSQASVLQWNSEHGVVAPLTEFGQPQKDRNATRNADSEVAGNTRPPIGNGLEATMSARSLVTEEELALLTQPLVRNEACKTKETVSDETTGEEGREPH